MSADQGNDLQAAQRAFHAANAAARAGDTEAANRHWKDCVYLLWKPMEHDVPWQKKDDANSPGGATTEAP